MKTITDSTNFIKSFAFRDSLFRSISLIGSSFTIACISLLPGFGVKGLLVASSIQLLLSGILELPTSIAADRFGRSLILKISLFLKIFVSIALGFAIYFSSIQNTELVWYAFFAEAFVDAISNSLVSGSYQVAYLSLYENKFKKLHSLPPLFLKSFEYGIKFRILFPLSFIIFIIFLFNTFEVFKLNLYACSYLILFFIILSRVYLFFAVKQDFSDIFLTADRSNLKTIPGLKSVFKVIKARPTLFISYSLTSLFNFIAILYLTGQGIKAFQDFGLNSNTTWTAAIGTSVIIYLIRTLLTVWLLPKISKDLLNMTLPFFGFLLITGSVYLIGNDFILNNLILKYIFFVSLASLLLIVSDTFSKSIESSLSDLILSDYKATWLSLGNTCSYFIFGIISTLISQFAFENSNSIVGILIFISGFYVLISPFLSKKHIVNPNFKDVMQKQLLKILIFIVILVVLIDVLTFTSMTHDKIEDTKTKTSNTVLLGIKSSILKGDIVEIGNFLFSLKSGNFVKCFKINLINSTSDDCSKNKINVRTLIEENLRIGYDSNEFGTIQLYFDFSSTKEELYFRVITDILLSFLLYIILFIIFHKLSNALSKEVEHLYLSLQDIDQIYKNDIIKTKEFKEIGRHIHNTIKLRDSFQLQAAMVNVASQVAHDIRSPLSALNMITSTLDEVSEDKRAIIRSSIQRINDIANDLLKKGKSPQTDATAESTQKLKTDSLLTSVAESILSEKRVQFKNKIKIQISLDTSKAYGIFVAINESEFKRVLSNIINNAVEAIGDKTGVVNLTLDKQNNFAVIKIIDNGPGIPENILEKLGKESVTFGKENSDSGSGLGVLHAKNTIESYAGSFSIQSMQGKGTTITLSLPISTTPVWFLETLNINQDETLIICDDDSSIHSLWKERFSSYPNLKILNFSTLKEIENWLSVTENLNSSFRLLIDFEFSNESGDGLSLISKYNLNKKSILVTSHFEESNIINKCISDDIKQIPKNLAGIVPIKILTEPEKIDAVILDDEELQERLWQFAAIQRGKNIIFLKTPDQLFHKLSTINTDTPIYIDSKLGDDIKGEDIALHLNKLGYKNLYLTTGYSAEDFKHLTFLKGVIGKTPKFD